MKQGKIIPLLFFVLCISAGISVCLGRYPVSARDFFMFLNDLFKGADMQGDILTIRNIIFDIRLPRIMTAILVGAALSTSGAAFQSMFMNPLVSPGILGVLAGAAFGACAGMMFSSGWAVVQVSAFLFGCTAVVLAFLTSVLYKGDRLLMLILGGIISGSLFTALLSLVKYLADPYSDLPAITYWLMGGFSLADKESVITAGIPICAGIILLILLSGHMNILSMGDEEAASLGINVKLVRSLLILSATFISAATVSLAGMIGWVGLVIPHITRMITGPDNRILVPASALTGGIYLLLMDDIARLLFSVEIPIGILTALAGIPFFAIVLKNSGKGWNS